MIKLCIILTFATLNVWADHTPTLQEHFFSVSSTITLVGKVKKYKLNPIISYQLKPEHFNNFLKKFTIGSYYRLFTNVKIGLFYQRQYGVMQDEDWILIRDHIWDWRNSSKRGEDRIFLDFTPKYRIKSFVGEVKLRYFYNFYNHHRFLNVRPGVTYFWFKNGDPFINFFGRYEVYLPINYSQVTIYEKWIYLGALYHFNTKFKIAVSYVKKNVTWSEYPGFIVLEPATKYLHKLAENVILLNFIWHL